MQQNQRSDTKTVSHRRRSRPTKIARVAAPVARAVSVNKTAGADGKRGRCFGKVPALHHAVAGKIQAVEDDDVRLRRSVFTAGDGAVRALVKHSRASTNSSWIASLTAFARPKIMFAELEAEVAAYPDQADRAEQWLRKVYTEIEDRFLQLAAEIPAADRTERRVESISRAGTQLGGSRL
jgi:hypothetical protein